MACVSHHASLRRRRQNLAQRVSAGKLADKQKSPGGATESLLRQSLRDYILPPPPGLAHKTPPSPGLAPWARIYCASGAAVVVRKVIAVGYKEGSRLIIRGREYAL